MTDSTTPICDLIEKLLSRGLSGTIAIETARGIEAALVRTATARGSSDDVRKYERLRKASYRAKRPGQSPGQGAYPITSKTQKLNKEVKEEESMSRTVRDKPAPADDWPTDHVDLFWKAFPPFRRQARAKVAAKLDRIRADGKVTWAVLFGGVEKFAATKPGEFAPAPMVWLNDGRWDREYGGSNGTSQGQRAGTVGFAGFAARARYGAPEPEPYRPSPEDLKPVNRR